MADNRRLVIVGDGLIAEVAYEYFTHDSEYEVVAFAVEGEYISRPQLFSLPIVPFENVEEVYPPSDFSMFVSVGYPQLNRLRARLYRAAKAKGFPIASYISSRAFVWPNVELGENCFIFESNVVQSFVRIGDCVTLWSGNHIGHHSVIQDNVFIASHVVISGSCDIGTNCFFGVNATVANDVKVARDCLIGAGALILHDTEPGMVYGAAPTPAKERTTYERFGISDIDGE